VAEEILVKEPLTQRMIEAGRGVLDRLDGENLNIVAAFWLLSGETNEWILEISFPEIEKLGPKKSYARIQKTLEQANGQATTLSLDNIKLVPPSDSLIKLLRAAVRTGTGTHGIRFSRNRINDTFIEDAYIYRLI
jgi:hypothetical protein